MKKTASVSLIIALIIVLFGGCTKKDTPPSLPPANSMSIDFSNFLVAQKSANIEILSQNSPAATKTNWTAAVTTAGFWNLLLTVNLVVPVASFKKAIDNTPVYIENKTWEWKFSVNVIGATYNARLTGQIQTSNVDWEMFISKDGVGAFSEFMWFSGTSALDGKSGQWILNHSQVFPDPLLQIDWALTGTDVGSIKYTYIRDLKDNGTTDLFKNSYIEYGLSSAALNAFYNVHYNISTTTTDFKDVYIEWSTTNHNGHIKALHYFQDSNWHCWDGTGNDVTCN
jgi:hypothetical protein